MRRTGAALAAAMLMAGAAHAADPSVIQVMGSGTVSTMPDVATIDYALQGEGRTADDASRALAGKQVAITQALRALLGAPTQLTSGNVSVAEVRDRQCTANDTYNSPPHLSEGVCAVIGYIATAQGSIRTASVAKAGTAVGLAARLGAHDARLSGFDLRDPVAAQRRAAQAAMADARARAEAIATASGGHLGPLVAASDQDSRNHVDPLATEVTGARNVVVQAPPPPPPPPPPIAIDVAPRPIDTQVQLYVKYSILP